ncbi:hypothetical protein [Erythrobacter sp. MTPC3]
MVGNGVPGYHRRPRTWWKTTARKVDCGVDMMPLRLEVLTELRQADKPMN